MVKIPGGVVKIPGMCGYCPRCNSRKAGTYIFGILTFIGISSCRRGCVWGAKFRFGVFVYH